MAAIRIASLFNAKARLWVVGRKDWREKLSVWRSTNPGRVVWFHCASLGEFEQGRSLMEAMHRADPQLKIVLTFFSPSGFEVRKNYQGAALVMYLPSDTPANAGDFIRILAPEAAFVIKYEYWANMFFACQRHVIPLYMASAILRPDQRFFGAFAGFWHKVLTCVTHFYVQNDETLKLVNGRGFSNATLTGDTRFDRVVEIRSQAREIPEIVQFKGASQLLVAGSTWEPDERVLQTWFEGRSSDQLKMVIVPHEIGEAHIRQVESRFPGSVRWSARENVDFSSAQILIVDTIGLLSSIYRYADVVMIGGGFGAGIHNTLEAAVWGVPVVFGPNYIKFAEAVDLVSTGAAFSGSSSEELGSILSRLFGKMDERAEAGRRAAEFVMKKQGATTLIMNSLKFNRKEKL